jgi:hypothetical protein
MAASHRSPGRPAPPALSMTRCPVCGIVAPARRHPCRFERACPCWRGRRCEVRSPRSGEVQHWQHGQALAETALVLPVLLFVCLGFVEAGFLLATKAAQDRATSTVAAWAAGHPGEPWAAVAAVELPGCDVTVAVATDPPDLVTASATCTYRPVVTRGLWDGLPISSSEAAVAWPTPDPTVAP